MSNTRSKSRAQQQRPQRAASAGISVRPGLPGGSPDPEPPAAAQPGGLKVLKLDAITREAREEHVAIDIDGQVFILANAEELDWLQSSLVPHLTFGGEDLRPIMQLLLGEQYDEFAKLSLTLGQINAIYEAWQTHHGITVPESNASQSS